MSQGGKSAYYQAIKAHGIQLSKHYRDYTTEELADLARFHQVPVDVPPQRDELPPRDDGLEEVKAQIAGLSDLIGQLAGVVGTVAQAQAQNAPTAGLAEQPTPGPNSADPYGYVVKPQLDPKQHAGVMLNLVEEGQPIRTDEHGNVWYQEEVTKPGYAKPRARRVVTEPGAKVHTETIKVAGGYTETFEVPGDPDFSTPTVSKVTLPSYQVGIYKPKGMPFKVHTYNGARGFDFDDVNAFYGHADLVPSGENGIKRIYVSSDLCYDIQSTVRAIEREYAQRVLRDPEAAK